MMTARRGRFGARVSPFARFRRLSATLVLAAALLPPALAAPARATAQNLVTNPSFETNTTGWGAYSGSTIARVAGGADGDWALEVRGPATVTTFGVNDSPNWIKMIAGAGTRYRFSAKVRSDSSTGGARLQIREYQGGVQRGTSLKTTPVPLTTSWQTISGEYVATTDSSTLDFQILDVPVAAGEVFLVDDVSIEAELVDLRPVITVAAAATVAETGTLELHLTAVDPDGDPVTSLTADLAGLPAGAAATFTPDSANASGVLAWTPGFDAAGGPYVVTFVASNALADTAATAITVTDVDRAPVLVAEELIAASENALVTIQVSASDPDGQPLDSLVADLSALPAGHDASFLVDSTGANGTFAWTPTFDDSGSYTIRFVAANALDDSAASTIVVAHVDRAPLVTAAPSVATQDSAAIVIEVSASDPDGDPIADLAADLAALPAGHDAVFTANEEHTAGTLTWTPRLGGSGEFAVLFMATNALADTATTIVSVSRIDHPPVIDAPAAIAGTEAESLAVTVTVADPDGDAIASLTADLSGLPAGANAAFTPAPDNASGTLAWTPGYDAAGGPYAVTFVAMNGDTASATLEITIANTDRAPLVSAPDTTAVRTGDLLEIEIQAADPDAEPIDSLVADLSALPAGHDAVFVTDAEGATLTWTPAAADTGAYLVTFTASNALAGAAGATILVLPPNQAPVAALVASPAITSTPQLVTADASGSSDPDDAIVSYTFDFGNGVVVGPQASPVASATFTAPGIHDVAVIVTDGFGARDTATARVRAHLGNLCVNPSFENTTAGWTAYGAGAAIVRVNGAGRTGSYAFQATKASGSGWGFNDSPDWVPLTAGPGRTYRYLAWVRSAADSGTVRLRLQEFLGGVQKGTTVLSAPVRVTTAWQLVGADYTTTTAGTRLDMKIVYDGTGTNEKFLIDDVQVLLMPAGDQPPLVMAPAAVTAIAGQPLAIPVRAADPDGEAITSVSASLALLPPGHDATFTPDADGHGGTIAWTPQAADVSPVPYTITVSAANGLTATLPIEVVVAGAPLANLCNNPGFETSASGWSPYVNGTALSRVNSGRTGRFGIHLTHATASGWGVNDQLDIVYNTAIAGRTYRYAAWVRSTNGSGKARIRIQEFLGSVQKGATTESPEIPLTSQWQRIAASYTATTSGTRLDFKILCAPAVAGESFLVDDVEVLLMPAGDRPPAIQAPAAIVVPRQQPMTLTVSASDPDGDPIGTLAADLSALPAGHDATFTPGPGNGTGILSWTPAAGDTRAEPYAVTFTASNAKIAIASAAITVTDSAFANLCANPGFETSLAGWGTYGAVTLSRVAGGHTGGFAMRMAGAGASTFGTDDTPNTVASVSAAGDRYRFSAWVRSDSSASPVRLRVYETLGGVQQGPVVLSYEVPASPTWQLVTVDHVALTAGSTLSLRVTMTPLAAGQSFLVDDVSIQQLPAGAALVAGTMLEAAGEDEALEAPLALEPSGELAFAASFAPNPMRGEGTLVFSLPRPGPVRVDLFDPAGRRVRTLVNEKAARAGRHTIALGSARLAAGVYFYRVDAAGAGLKAGRVVVLE